MQHLILTVFLMLISLSSTSILMFLRQNHDESLNSFDVDLSSFKNAIETIGSYCKEDVLVLVETTVPPGTCQVGATILHENFLIVD